MPSLPAGSPPPSQPPPSALTLTLPLLASLALLSATGPIATDLYLPSLPLIVKDLDTSDSTVQLTLSGFMLGLGVGQLIIGPISDALGRRGLLIAGAAVQVVAAAGCALAPNAGILVALRLLHGLGGGACVVLARAVVPDIAGGKAAAKGFALLLTIQSIAPILAPIVGGFLVGPVGWRGLFWLLAAIAASQLAVVLRFIPETAPAALAGTKARHPGRILSATAANYRYVLRNPALRMYALAFGFGFSVMFSYIAASSFVVQKQLGLGPQIYSLVFGLNAVGLLLGNLVNSKLVERFPAPVILRTALSIQIASGVFVSGAAVLAPAPLTILPPLFVAVSLNGVVLACAMAAATAQVRERAGSASAVLGATQFFLASILSPAMGVGHNPALTMGIGMTACGTIALAAAFLAKLRTRA